MDRVGCFTAGVISGAFLATGAALALQSALFGTPAEIAAEAERRTSAAWEKEFAAEVLARHRAEVEARRYGVELVRKDTVILEKQAQIDRLSQALTPGWELSEDAARRRQMHKQPADVPPGDLIPAQAVPER